MKLLGASPASRKRSRKVVGRKSQWNLSTTCGVDMGKPRRIQHIGKVSDTFHHMQERLREPKWNLIARNVFWNVWIAVKLGIWHTQTFTETKHISRHKNENIFAIRSCTGVVPLLPNLWYNSFETPNNQRLKTHHNNHIYKTYKFAPKTKRVHSTETQKKCMRIAHQSLQQYFKKFSILQISENIKNKKHASHTTRHYHGRPFLKLAEFGNIL